MKTITIILSIVWTLTIFLTLYLKLSFLGLDANSWGLIFSAIFAMLTSIIYFHEKKSSNKHAIQQSATASHNSSVLQVGRDYKTKGK